MLNKLDRGLSRGRLVSMQEHRTPGAAAGASHAVHFYGDDASLIERLTDFVSDGITARDACIVIATPAHRAALQPALAAAGVAARPHQLVVLDAATTLQGFMRSGRPDRDLFESTVGRTVRSAAGTSRGVSAYGEMVALLWAYGNAVAALELEEMWNDLQRDVAFRLLCAYPTRDLHRGEVDGFAEICARHTAHSSS